MSQWTVRWIGVLGVAAACVGLIGCSGGSAKPTAPQTADAKPDASKNDVKSEGPTTTAQHAPLAADPLYHPFLEAVRDANDPPGYVNKPADMTLTNKPTFQLLGNVQQHWDEIRFTTPDGKRIQYTAVLDTDYGPIEISLRPDAAPNHVRNFVALIEAGYYDGMRFDRIHHEVSPDAPNDPLDFIEAGCPLDKGGPLDGSIGYWLRPELGSPLHHEVGAVGAMHGPMPDSASCKFYIMLCDAPYMDGNYTVFGKVTAGLDKVRKIFMAPVVVDDSDPPYHNRLKDPIIIRKATVRTQVVAAAEGK